MLRVDTIQKSDSEPWGRIIAEEQRNHMKRLKFWESFYSRQKLCGRLRKTMQKFGVDPEIEAVARGIDPATRPPLTPAAFTPALCLQHTFPFGYARLGRSQQAPSITDRENGCTAPTSAFGSVARNA
jgi:hypothetical protein